MAKRTPKSPATGGHEERDSKPDARPSGPRFGDKQTGFPTTEDQEPAARKRTGSTGAESMSQLDAERVAFEEPTHPYDGITSRPMDEE